jgi:NAD(P)H dehydrogenase (quinone)
LTEQYISHPDIISTFPNDFHKELCMRIGVTGASGQLGMGVVRHLLSRTSASNIVAITRSPEKLAAFSSQGVNVRKGDFNDGPGLEKALGGVERLLIIPGSDLTPNVRPVQHRTAINAGISAGVSHIVYTSSLGARPGPSDGIMETHFTTEQALITSGATWTLLRMSIYAEMLLDNAKQALSTHTYAALRGAPAAYILRDDLAATAAGLLTTNGHDGVTYHATGPAALTAAQIADIIAKVARTTVQYSAITAAQLESGLAAAGLPTALVNVISRFQQALQAGAFDMVTGDVERLSGRRPQSVEEFMSRSLGKSTAQAG